MGAKPSKGPGTEKGAVMRRAKGFNLVELLVVVAIVTVALALGFTGFYRVNENALRTVCASNLNQLGLSTMVYFDDHRRMPAFSFNTENQGCGTVDLYIQANKIKSTGWDAYDPDLLICPKDEAPAKIPVFNRFTRALEYRFTSYAYNLAFIIEGLDYTSLNNPSNTPLLFDGSMDLSAGSQGELEYEQTPGKEFSNNGHGNNEDQVDKSNPGKGWTRTKTDSDPNVDDEIRPFKNKHGVGPQVVLGHFVPATPDAGDSFFLRRHDVNPRMGNVIYADGHVEGLDKAPDGYVEIPFDPALHW